MEGPITLPPAINILCYSAEVPRTNREDAGLSFHPITSHIGPSVTTATAQNKTVWDE